MCRSRADAIQSSPGTEKYVLKQAGRGLVIGGWMARGPIFDHVENRILGSGLQSEGVIDFSAVRRILSLQRSGKVNLSMYVSASNLAAWYERLIDRQPSVAA
jgi:hypothetical protein